MKRAPDLQILSRSSSKFIHSVPPQAGASGHVIVARGRTRAMVLSWSKGPSDEKRQKVAPKPKEPKSETEAYASLKLIRDAAKRIAPFAKVTPVHTCSSIDDMMSDETDKIEGATIELFFKCETFQKGGAFKFRGAMNSILQLSKAELKAGVVTHSSGNHAGALALAAKTKGIPSYIVVPEGAPQCKLDAIETYGGQITRCEATVPDREATCAKIQTETGATLVPPYNYGPVICGQGTIGLEFMEQVPDLDVVIVPISGGGMISGIAAAVKGIRKECVVIAAEPIGATAYAADTFESKKRNKLVDDLPVPDTIADGLKAKMGTLTWPVVRDKVDAVITVTEDEIVAAMKVIYERMKLVVEPSGAVGLAAAMSTQFKEFNRQNPPWGKVSKHKKVGVVLCGGNVDLALLAKLFAPS